MSEVFTIAADVLEAERREAWRGVCSPESRARFVKDFFSDSYQECADWRDGFINVAPSEPTEPDGTWAGHWPLRGGYPPRGQNVVYVLRDLQGNPRYVGSTNDFMSRVSRHARRGKTWQTWSATSYQTRESAYAAEDAYLAEYVPPMNIMGSRRRRVAA